LAEIGSGVWSLDLRLTVVDFHFMP
jgi:hypothetical protein